MLIRNHGQLITVTDYWDSEWDRLGKIAGSCNAGAIRLLLPRAKFGVVGEVRSSEYAICSRGPWPEMGLDEAVELLFEDHSDSPFALHLHPETFDAVPGAPEKGREWIVTLWVEKDGRPKKALERPCKWRRSERIPDLSPWRV